MIKTLPHPTFGQVKLGRRRLVARGPHLRLENYLMKSLPTAPDCDYSSRAARALDKIYLNDRLGDCVIACGAHLFGVLNENAQGNPSIFTDPEIIDYYHRIGGFDPSQTQPDGSNPTDNGCDEQTALNYWTERGMIGHHMAGWLSVNAADEQEVRSAVWLFENLVFGVELPDAWVNPVPASSGFTWDVAGATDPSNGHCFLGCGSTPAGISISTWGMVGLVTYQAIAAYAVPGVFGELYTVLSQESINKAKLKAPNGFNWAQLVRDFDSIGGHV